MPNRGKVIILAAPGYEDLELWYPKLRLEEAGYETIVAGLGESSYAGKHGYPCPVSGDIGDFQPEAFKGIVIPGGQAPTALRRDTRVLSFTRKLHEAGRLVAAICHGGWVLSDAGIVGGRRMTSHPELRNDLVAAGASWVDEPIVIDGNLVTSRRPADLPLFGAGMVRVLWERELLLSQRYEPHAPV